MTAREVFTLRQAWDVNAPPREQTFQQNVAEDKFNWLLEKIQHAGGEVSPVRRSMHPLKDEDGRDYLMLYDQIVLVTASEEVMPHLKELVN